MPLTIAQVLDRIPAWQGHRPTVSPLGGGLTNTNYRVDAAGHAYVVRMPGASTELLAVDRANEHHNTRAAAAAGVCPRVVEYLADASVMVLEFVPGETMTSATLRQPGMPTRMALALRQLHAGPRFLLDFNMFRLVERYLAIVAERSVPLPEGYHGGLPALGRIEAAFARDPPPTVPCHNDLLAGNYLDDGQKLWLIDFEYSGNNDPTFELGNTCQEQEFDEPRIVEMCAAYFGVADADKLARMKLNMIVSDFGWTLWAAIQATISAIDFDYAGWARQRWGRARAKLATPDFEAWLAAV